MRDILRRSAHTLMTVLRVAAGAMLVASVAHQFRQHHRPLFPLGVAVLGRGGDAVPDDRRVFLGAGPVGWLGRHIRMDVVVSLLPPRARKIFEVFSDLVTIATCVMLAIFAWPVMTMLAELDQRSDTANIPLVIPAGRGAARAFADGAA